eukprot:1162049-Pelagomonas_calceolata.AAC.4
MLLLRRADIAEGGQGIAVVLGKGGIADDGQRGLLPQRRCGPGGTLPALEERGGGGGGGGFATCCPTAGLSTVLVFGFGAAAAACEL